MVDLGDFVFPIRAVTPGDPPRGRFLGTGFWLDAHGHFATCKHVMESLVTPELFHIKSLDAGGVTAWWKHSTLDVAVGKAAVCVGKAPAHSLEEIGLGMDLGAIGYTEGGTKHSLDEHGKPVEKHMVDVRYLKGYVSVYGADRLHFPAVHLNQVSFGSPTGFSGTPLMDGQNRVVGVLYGNIDTRIESYALSEVLDGEKSFSEKAYRIYEHGLFHAITDLHPFFKECGVDVVIA